ncbi:MAG: FAD-binding protein [Rhizobiaceae bacterium]|nr:FAD-binding protein [Rhizobiaceae bacterium]
MTHTRRSMLQAGLACATTFTIPTRTIAQQHSTIIDAPGMGGVFDRTPAALAAAADDFGHLVHGTPAVVFRPGTTTDISALVRLAGERGEKVTARGQGHSIYGRATSIGQTVVVLSTLDKIDAVQSDRVTVEAGTTWRSVLKSTLLHRLTPPVLPNYLDLSVGGTLTLGGIGGTTSRYGMMTDNVLELTVVTGDGREMTCSRTQNPDLFDAVRAGLAQCGIITRATLALISAPDHARRYLLQYRNLQSLTKDQLRLLADRRFDHLQGSVAPDPAGGWRHMLEGVVFFDADNEPDDTRLLVGLSDDREAAMITDSTYFEYLSAFDNLEQKLRASGQWSKPHPWLLTFLPGSKAEEIVADVLSGLTADDLGPIGQVSYYPFRTEAVRTPLLRMPKEPIAFTSNVIRMPNTDGAAAAERLVAHNRFLYEKINQQGGVLYPVSAFPMSSLDWRQHFGVRWKLLKNAKHRFDPGGTLAPGYELF